MSVGRLGHLAMKQEDGYGNEATPPTVFGEIIDESLAMDNNLIVPELCSGTRFDKRVLLGAVTGGGSFNIPLFAEDLTPLIFKSLMGTVNSSLVSAGVYDHTFTTLQGAVLPSYTIQVDAEASAQNWVGSNISGVTFSMAPNDIVMMAVDVISQYPKNVAAAVASFTTLDPFVGFDVSITLNSESNVDFENLSLTISNEMEGVPTLNNERWIAKNIAKAFKVNGSFSLEYGDNDLRQLLWGSSVATQPLKTHASGDLTITMTSQAEIVSGYNYTITITIPVTFYGTAPANVAAAGRIMQEVAFVTKYDPGTDKVADIVLRNSQASYPDP